MKSSLPDRHDVSETRRDDPIAQITIGGIMRDSPHSGSGQAIPTFGAGQVMPAKKQL